MRIFRGIALALFVAIGGWGFLIWSVYFKDDGAPPGAEAVPGQSGLITERIGEGFFALRNAGGNITVSTGADGLLVVDTGVTPMVPDILAALGELGAAKSIVVVNTHAHSDHREGNVSLKDMGAVIMSHALTAENIRTSNPDPSDPRLVPTVTYEDRHQFMFNGQTISLIHLPRAHTNGDTLVHFFPANIIALGDVYQSTYLPGVSLEKEGSIDGLLKGQDIALALADSETIVVPGHGPVGSRAELAAVRANLGRVRDRIAFLKGIGVSRRLLPLFHPMAAWPKDWREGRGTEKTMARVYWLTLPE